MPRFLRVALPAVLIPLALWAFVPVLSHGARTSAEIEQDIEAKQSQIDKKKAKEKTLSTTISGYSSRINALEDDIEVLQGRQDRIQSDLDVKKAELGRIQTSLRLERRKLAKLRAKLSISRKILALRLAEIYKAEKPDFVTVVLTSKGFAELIERGEFMARINEQDQEVITSVREAKARTKRTADRLDRLEDRQQKLTAQVQQRRNEVAAVKGELVGKQDGWQGLRAEKADVLDATRAQRGELQEDLASLEKEQAKVEGVIRGAPAPVKRGSGNMIWPVNGSVTSPFGMRWGRLHAGIDIGAGHGTPIRAADGGTVVLAGWTGGYGNYTCISHGGGISTCYAHQSSYATSTGANVSQGEVIGYVGNTGHSFGAHLHFEVRVNGSPTDPLGYL